MEGQRCFYVNVAVCIRVSSWRKRELGIVDNKGVVDVLQFVYFKLRDLIQARYIVSPNAGVVIWEKRAGKKIRLVSDGVVVAVNVRIWNVVKEVKVVARCSVIVVNIVLYLHVGGNQIGILFLKSHLKDVRLVLFYQDVFLLVDHVYPMTQSDEGS